MFHFKTTNTKAPPLSTAQAGAMLLPSAWQQQYGKNHCSWSVTYAIYTTNHPGLSCVIVAHQ